MTVNVHEIIFRLIVLSVNLIWIIVMTINLAYLWLIILEVIFLYNDYNYNCDNG